MRPINLTFQAFGAFNNLVQIPFEKLGNLYLLTGVTGSGKTTIFDALIYALFNTASGSLRSSSDFRSHYANEDTKTFVELEFLYNGETYKIKRSPSYLRKKLRGEGYIETSAEAELYLPDGKIITNVKEVDLKITEILGVNAAQFSKIALLAQGEFLKLLNAETNERTQIFRNIFKTNDFLALEEKLKEKLLFYKNNYENLKTSITQYIEQLILNEELNLSKEEILNNSSLSLLNDFIKKIKDFIESDEESFSNIQKNIQISDEKLKSNLRKLDLIKTKENLINEKSKTEKEYKEREIEFSEKNKALSTIPEKQKIYEKQSIELNKLLQDVEKSKQLQEENQKIELLNKNLKEKKESLEKLKNGLQNLKKDYIINSYSKMIDFENKLKDEQEKFIKLKTSLEKEKFEFNELENKYLSSQAGILAQKLEENKPCPVCGAINHPNPAKLKETVLSKDELDKIKEKLSNDSEFLNKISLNCADLIQKQKNSKDFFENLKKRFEINLNKNELSNKIKSFDFEAEIKNNEEITDNCNNNINEIKNELSKSNALIKILIENLKSIDPKEIIEKYNELTKKQNELKNEISNTTIEYEKINNIIQKYKSNLELYSKQIEELKDIKIEEFDFINNEIQEIEKENAKLNLKNQEILIRKNLNSNLIKQIEEKFNEITKIEKNYAQYKILSDVSSGQMTGKAKISFEHYIQSYYLDLVLFEANKRLKTMSRNQFHLLRKKSSNSLKSKTALELEVMDYHTFKTRSTKTLSGGESFIAALSLALGLSDCISNLVGAININSIFIDEGFGSLDSETLELALNTINNLANSNKTIAVISHIERLKSAIKTQIIANKTNFGSNITVVY